MKRKLLYLIGFPGVGKLTIANEICRMENFILQDNHKTVNLLFPYLDLSKQIPMDAWADIITIRKIIYDFIKRNYNKDSSLIFTDCLRDNDDDAQQVFNEIADIANNLDLDFYPVFLHCDMKEIRRRIGSEDRSLKYKLTSVENAFFEWKGLVKVEYKDQIHMDVSKLKAIEAAREILRYIREAECLK